MTLMKIFLSIVLCLSVATGAHAAMVRVVEVVDGRTLIIERGGLRETIHLGGIEVQDELRAAELLRWTAGTAWILAEARADGDYFVWRSPDALFLNRELVLRGYARATQHGIEPEVNLHVTYLGEVNPSGVRPGARPFDPPAVSAPPQTGSGTNRRSSARPSRRTRSARARPGSGAAASPSPSK